MRKCVPGYVPPAASGPHAA